MYIFIFWSSVAVCVCGWVGAGRSRTPSPHRFSGVISGGATWWQGRRPIVRYYLSSDPYCIIYVLL